MIYLYESAETDFRYNGKPLPASYDVTVSNTLNSEYYAMGKHPLDKDKVYKEIVEDRIIKVHTMDGLQPFRIVNVSKHELYVEFEAWPLFYADMRNKLVKPLNLKGVSGQTALNSFKNNLLIDTPFDFYSDITDNYDYHTQDENERENNPKQLYNALDIFKTIVNLWGGELWIRGYDIRVNKRIGRDTEAMLYEKKNITEFVDTTNIEGIVTRLHGKSEWTSQEHVDSGSETVIPTDPSERPAAPYKGTLNLSKLNVGDPVTIRSGMQYFLTFRKEKNPETNRDKTYYYQIPIKKDHTGHKDEIAEVKTGVRVGYSYNAYYLKNLQKWVLAQDIVESYGKEGVFYGIETTVDSPLINNYGGIVFEKQYTNNDIRTEQELKNWLNLKFTNENIDKPQRAIEVGTNVIDGTKIGFADTLILKYIKHDTDVRIKVVGYEYDGFANELKHVVLGQPKNTSSSTIGNTITDLVNDVVEPVDRKTTIAMSTADGKSTVFHGTADPNTLNLNAKENDTYFRTNGSEREIWRFTGTLWEKEMDSADTTKNAREIEAVIEQAEADKTALEREINQTYADAVAEADRLAAIRDDGITITAGQIIAGTIDTARLDAVSIVTSGLYANVIKSEHIQAENALFDKLFTSTLATDRLSAQTAWIKNGMFANASIDGAKIQNATIGSAKIANLDASKITTGTLEGIRVEAVEGYIGGWNLESGGLYKKTPYGYTTLKPGGNVAIGIASPNYGYTTGAALQIWHDGTLRFGELGTRIYSTIQDNLRIMSHNRIVLMANATVESDSRIIPMTNGDLDLGATDRRWQRVRAKFSEDVSSDARHKKNIQEIPQELLRIIAEEVKPKEYEMDGMLHYGYVAQDVERALFKYSYSQTQSLEKANKLIKRFDFLIKDESYLSLVYTEIAVIKEAEMQTRMDRLEKKIKELENAS